MMFSVTNRRLSDYVLLPLKRTILAHFATGVDESIPRITVPQEMVKRVHKIMTRKAIIESRRPRPSHKSPLVISCNRKEFNHRRGETRAKNDADRSLFASHGWMHRKSAGDHFTLMCHKSNPALMSDKIDFSTLGINESLSSALNEQLSLDTPTNIQSLALPKILEGHNSLCVAETGSGKTFAYLLPIMELIDRQRELTLSKEPALNAPLFIVLAPAREIAQQIQSVSESLTAVIPHSTQLYCGQQRIQAGETYTKSPVDIVISTPGALATLLRFRRISPSRLQMIVLDEIDSLLDDSFNSTIHNILRKLKFTCGSPSGDTRVVSTGTQIVFVGATVPRDMNNIIGDIVPVDGLETIATNHVHKVLPHVSQKFVRVLPSTKPEILLQTIKSTKYVPTIIFCNRNQTAWWVSEFLKSNNIPNLLIHGRDEQREGTFDRFQAGESDILVATDVCSRGLDTLRVERVMNYEFPNFVSDYIHRVGRVGRVGSHRSGHVISFVSHKWEVEVLWAIEASARQSTEIYNVNANIKRKLTGVIRDKYMSNIQA